MKKKIEVITILVVIILLFSTIYAVYYYNPNEKSNNELTKDKEPPKIDFTTENTTGTNGKITSILATFSDNINVTNATIYFKKASLNTWNSKSILSGRFDLEIPESSIEDWYYYITVDDKAGNGPVGKPSADGSIYYIIDVTRRKTDLEHKVFIEEGTASWCSNCPKIEKILHEVYEPEDPNFYYVSLVSDKNKKAEERLYDHYNIYGFPTVFFDGGYTACCIDVEPEERNADLFREKLSKVESRDHPELYIDVNATWDDDKKELITDVIVENYENEKYNGILKVYITEIKSRWADWEGTSYHYAFLDYSIDKTIEIKENEQSFFTGTWNSKDFPDIYPENLWVVAVLFNSEEVKKYSDPPQNEREYNANFADATDGTKVANGTLPPGIGISFPNQWNRYILGKEKGRSILGKTIILGKISIKTNINSEEEIEKVEINIKGFFREKTITLYEEPYEYMWDTFSFGRYTITVTVYDKKQRTAADDLEVFAFII